MAIIFGFCVQGGMGKQTGTILVVHGTGVRTFDIDPKVREAAAAAGMHRTIVACPWGELLGVDFAGQSLPDGPAPDLLQKEEEDFARWGWLFDDPTCELKQMAIPPSDTDAPPTIKCLTKLDAIRSYKPGNDVGTLLNQTGFQAYWAASRGRILDDDVVDAAFKVTPENELPDICRVLARAIVAELHRRIATEGLPLPGMHERNTLVELLLKEWGMKIFGLKARALRVLANIATKHIRQDRARVNEEAGRPIGDILRYQANFPEVHAYLRRAIERATPPVILVGHSLGGIACVDLLAAPDPPAVAGLVTAGSQAPMLHEMGALMSLKPKEELPHHFPRWLNVFDRNDFLGFVSARIFPGRATDVEVSSRLPFPESHSAYFKNEVFWAQVETFAAECGA